MSRIIRCQCTVCADRNKCKYAVKVQRMPRENGGLGLCPRLADNSDPVFNEDKGQYERGATYQRSSGIKLIRGEDK